jgi:hypothetical protein
MVFHLIEEQVFGKQDSDRREDFSGIFDFEEALVKPFLPKRAVANTDKRAGKAARPQAEDRVSKPQAKG